MARILLVDDEQDVREMLRDALKHRGHAVDIAATQEEALKLAAKSAYDIAIVDYVLPGKKKGIELLHELRDRLPFMRSVIISGQIDHDTLSAAQLERELKTRVAADRYVRKPASIAEIERVINELLKPSQDGDWKEMASDAVAKSKIRKSHVRDMSRVLARARKKKI